ncbi:BofC C-terminal domain-containing protein [Paenibacillus oryzae]|uniref:BofC C-terminal domain-containing protein n=1 Tax=Paenibacillus oryzae TaxID=1844972 RepID=UPI0009ED2DC4|nr:BofC C-terminal domain-containing protein [Paenibacillus oryzae]
MMTFHPWRQLKKRLRRGRRPLWSLGGLAARMSPAALWVIAAASAAWLTALPLAGGVVFAASGEGAATVTVIGSAPTTSLDNAEAAAPGSSALFAKGNNADIAKGNDIVAESPEFQTPHSISRKLQELKQNGERAEVVMHILYVCGEETESLGSLNPDEIASLLSLHPGWTASMEPDGLSVRLERRVNDLSPHCKSHAYFGIDRSGNFSLYDGEPKDDKVMRTFFQLDIGYLESSLPAGQFEQLSRGIRVCDIEEYNSVLSTFSDYAIDDGTRDERPQAY